MLRDKRQGCNWSLRVAGIAAILAAPLTPQSNNSVQVISAVKVMVAKTTPALRVAYRYEFHGKQTVYIRGLGMVAARGEYEYLTRDASLQVRDAPDGAILADVPIKETVVVAAKAPLNYVPPQQEFPAAFRSEVWSSAASLQDRVNAVLRKYFSYMPSDDNKVNYVATTFTPLQVDKLPAGATAQLALLISFPHDAAANRYSFRVHSLVEEGRLLSDDTRPTSNPNIQKSADRFVDQLINEIKMGAEGRP